MTTIWRRRDDTANWRFSDGRRRTARYWHIIAAIYICASAQIFLFRNRGRTVKWRGYRIADRKSRMSRLPEPALLSLVYPASKPSRAFHAFFTYLPRIFQSLRQISKDRQFLSISF
jgi:hypothetical protein